MFEFLSNWFSRFRSRFFRKYDNKILSIYFGIPGSGKSTIAAAISRRCLKHGVHVFCNFPVKGTDFIDAASVVGYFDLGSNAKLIVDEASICYNNRNFKSFPKEAIQWYKLHRHYDCSVDVFSQSYDDMDITLRRLANRLYLVKKSLIPYFVCAIPIRRRVGINDMTKEICDEFYFDSPLLRIFTTKRYFAPLAWRMFDSWAAPELPPISNLVN